MRRVLRGSRRPRSGRSARRPSPRAGATRAPGIARDRHAPILVATTLAPVAKVERKGRSRRSCCASSSARCCSFGASRRRSKSASGPASCRDSSTLRSARKVAVGVCRALEEGDVFASTHRAHGHTLAKWDAPQRADGRAVREARGLLARLRRLDAPLRRRTREPRRERRRRRGLPVIVGAALAFKFRDEPRVGVAFFGDGATNIGTFHEALNLAQLWNVPAVFVCEHNHWGGVDPPSSTCRSRT